jgi:hypothetical protein
MLLIILTKNVTSFSVIEMLVTQWVIGVFNFNVFSTLADGAFGVPQPLARCADLWR